MTLALGVCLASFVVLGLLCAVMAVRSWRDRRDE